MTLRDDLMEILAQIDVDEDLTMWDGVPDTEVRTTSDTGGEKGVKLERYDLIPVRPLEELARRYGIGAQKYDERNWERGYEWSKSYAAMQRHLNAFWRGENDDPETPGSSHLAAAAFHIFALMEFVEVHSEYDDRSKEV